ncbi:thioredoxin-like protein [Endogone sp. FLAS-F59071]|nr:thioredoxin-like protein [Endogone sp. FLAS-F59071]|eukprot:RUS22024.1 thioredoxin-like protein [Endogone sp. FLAS-F59071]
MVRSLASRIVPIAKARNGVGAYVLQCRKLVFNYCEHGGSSKGMIDYIQSNFLKFAKENPQIEMLVQNRPGHHPIIRGFYLNGRDKVICVRKMSAPDIADKVKLLRDSSGAKLKKLTKKSVLSTTESVRGIWSPFHTKPHKI